ncbi:MAG: FtsK/SpoIIIE domain-containing protein [Cetobacterium sp.]
MIFYIKTIETLIKEQLSDKLKSNTLIRLENFNSLDLYFQLAKEMETYAKENNLELIIKLSKNKFNHLKDTSSDFLINKFLEKDWVDLHNQMTLWRNQILEKSSLILLLGTEEIEDRGGLEDFYKITPEIIDLNLKDNYHKIFEDKFPTILAGNEKIIDSFYGTIFTNYPKNLLKVSTFVDSLNEKKIPTMDTLIKELFSSLYEVWGIPNILNLKNLKRSSLKGKNKIKEIETAIDFKERKKFKTLTKPQMAKYLNKIKTFKEDNLDLIENLDLNSYTSFNDFEEDLSNYILGKNIEKIKNNLFQIDFTLIKDILDLKIVSNKVKTSEKTIQVKGDPLLVFYRTLSESLKIYETNNSNILDIVKISIDIEEIGIANCSEGEKENIFFNFWSNLCKNLKGLKTFINNQEFFLNQKDEYISIEYFEGKDEFFNLEDFHILKETILKRLAANKTYSYMNINILLENSQEQLNSYKFQWNFSNLDSWFMAFEFFSQEFIDSFKTKGTELLPIFEMNKIDNLLNNANEEHEFFNFIERNQSSDYFNLITSKEIPEDFQDDLEILGRKTITLIKNILDLGFFNLINQNIFNDFISKYKNILEKLLSLDIEANKVENREFLRKFLYLYTTIKSHKILEEGNDPEYILVNPIHPGYLEKLLEKIIFIKDALKAIGKDFNDLDSKIEKIINLTAIDSSLDVSLGKDSYLITKKSFGSYSIMAPFKINESIEKRLDFNSILKKENSLTDEKENNLVQTEKSKYFQDIIKKYLEIYPNSLDGLKISFINPEDLQSIVKAIWDIKDFYKTSMNISLYIFTKEENIGGKSYFSYWINELYEKFDNLKIQVYYTTHCDLENLDNNLNNYLPGDMDLIFISEALTDSDLKFGEVDTVNITGIENKFPMIYKPLPFNSNSFKREIEITQNQFQIATLHSKLVNKFKNNITLTSELDKSLLKEFKLNDSMKNILNTIKSIGNWIILIDKGIDKQLLSALNSWDILSISTGKGNSGELNIVIGAGRDQLENIKTKITNRITHLFSNLKYDKDSLNTLIENAFKYMKVLDGINILKTMSLDNTQIHNYIGYMLTYREFEMKDLNWGLIPLDFYGHWFNSVENRPDYLALTYDFIDDELHLTCDIIECKIAKKNSLHLNKALDQIKAGYSALVDKFDPNKPDLEKRYWLLQLYKAFVYCTASDFKGDYSKLTKELFLILKGQFKIHWKGSIYTYWLDGENTEVITQDLSTRDLEIVHFQFPKTYLGKSIQEEVIIQMPKETKYNTPEVPNIETERQAAEYKPVFKIHDSINNTTPIKAKIKSVLMENNYHESLDSEKKRAEEMLRNLCKFYNERKCEIDPGDYLIGPSIIRLRIKLNNNTNFSDIERKAIDLKLYLALDKNPHIFPDKNGYVSIDIPREKQGIIYLSEIINKVTNLENSLKFILGINEEGNPIWVDLSDSNTTHLLVAGASGGGKSVLLNSIIINIMTNYTPEQVKFIFIDPKYVEMGMYEDSPFLYRDIITDIETAIEVLQSLTLEMDERYKEFAKVKVKDIESYNKISSKKLPRIVVVFDEYADFMEEKEWREDLERSLKRITQKARAAGIHIIISTQSPKSEIITTTIRNNLSARIALKVSDSNASRIILDESGAENLLGKGDMFFKNPNEGILNRLKSPYIPTEELDNILKTLKEYYKTND